MKSCLGKVSGRVGAIRIWRPWSRALSDWTW